METSNLSWHYWNETPRNAVCGVNGNATTLEVVISLADERMQVADCHLHFSIQTFRLKNLQWLGLSLLRKMTLRYLQQRQSHYAWHGTRIDWSEIVLVAMLWIESYTMQVQNEKAARLPNNINDSPWTKAAFLNTALPMSPLQQGVFHFSFDVLMRWGH